MFETKSNVTPIFIFSLPRSGSTLLQRILMTSDEIATVSEPWFLLPYLTMLKKEVGVSVYGTYQATDAINDFISKFPNKENDYKQLLREYILSNYKLLAGGKTFFIDKTPRYFYIIPEIYELFPDAKFIFLIRNPLSIYASMMLTDRKNSFKLIYRAFNNFKHGYKLLAEGYNVINKNAHVISYNDLVQNTEATLKDAFEYLGIESPKKIELNLIEGKMGDKTGVTAYKKISSNSIDKWKTVFNTGFRKKVLINYIKDIDEVFFTTFQLNRDIILKEIKELNVTYRISIKDRIYFFLSKVIFTNNLNFYLEKQLKWAKKFFIS